MNLFNILLLIHIISGSITLAAATAAISTKSFNSAHRWHRLAGKVFFYGMILIFLTAVPMSLIKLNIPLLLIAILSFYVAFSGWRFARNRKGTPQAIDTISSALILIAGIGMLLIGIVILVQGDLNAIILLVFGGISVSVGISNFRIMRSGGVRGRERVANHMTMMLAGTIAALTAFTVTNLQIEPLFIPWLAPTVLIFPIMKWWENRLTKGFRPTGMPEPSQGAD